MRTPLVHDQLKNMNRSVFIGVTLMAASLLNRSTQAEDSFLSAGDHERVLTVGTRHRKYFVHLPEAYHRRNLYPVVLVFHGGGSNAKQWIPFCAMNETADKHGFIAVYPNGTGKTIEGYDIFGWNGGPRQPGGTNAALSEVDDVGFTKSMLDDLATKVKVDTNRIFATGMSMGAIMVYRLASEMSDRIAAIAPIAGPMGTQDCHPTQPVSVIHFHGTEDEAVPFAGGRGKLDPSGTEFYSVEHSIHAWVKANGCAVEPTIEALPEKANDGTMIIRKSYRNGRSGAEVVLIEIQGGGHTWPDREFGPELKVLGRCTKNISANETMWEFFQRPQ